MHNWEIKEGVSNVILIHPLFSFSIMHFYFMIFIIIPPFIVMK
jgi:hypothetical protein